MNIKQLAKIRKEYVATMNIKWLKSQLAPNQTELHKDDSLFALNSNALASIVMRHIPQATTRQLLDLLEEVELDFTIDPLSDATNAMSDEDLLQETDR